MKPSIYLRRFLIAAVLLAALLLSFTALAEANRAITLEADETVVYVGKKIKITPAVENLTDEAPKKTTLVWSTSDPKVAKVTGGQVTGVAPGKAVISCHAKDDETIAVSLTVEVRQAVKSIVMEQKTASLLLGADTEKAQTVLSYSITPDNAYDQTAVWSSSDEGVATVDQDGTVHGIAPGKATIYATSADLKKPAQCTVTVGQAVSRLTLSQSSMVMDKGKKVKLTADVLPENAQSKKVTWSSSNENVLKVDANGNVTAKSTGKATITATAADGSGITSQCAITVVQPVTKVSFPQKKQVLFAGKTTRIVATVQPGDATDPQVRWKSSDTSIATVDDDGTVTAKSRGTATITATARDGSEKSASYTVTVEPVVPITLESIGTGKYLPNLLGMTVKNQCKTMTIVDFDFSMELYTYNGTTISQGSYSLGKNVSIAPGSQRTIKRTASGVGYSSKIVITITGVTFKDGSYYSIPQSERDTWTFRVH